MIPKCIKISREYIPEWSIIDSILVPYYRCQTHRNGCIIFYGYSNGKPSVCCLRRMPLHIALNLLQQAEHAELAKKAGRYPRGQTLLI